MFEDMFVLEMASNHWGSIDRGLEIIDQYSEVIRENEVRGSIKLQIRDVDSFIHERFRLAGDSEACVEELTKRERYIQKIKRTGLNFDEYRSLVDHIRSYEIEPMATAFDEKSVDVCMSLGMRILKIASADFADFNLLSKISETRLPVIASTGGCAEHEIDRVVNFFAAKNVPLALNHCVSLYPTEDNDLHLNQIDYLKERYPELVIGFSTHEYTDWRSSMYISYAKGARLWERHIDIPYPADAEQKDVSPYCSLPSQIDTWLKTYHHARLMCGSPGASRRRIEEQEVEYLRNLRRGLYFSRDIRVGQVLRAGDYYSAIPCQYEIGQMPSGSVNNFKYKTAVGVTRDEPVTNECLEVVLP